MIVYKLVRKLSDNSFVSLFYDQYHPDLVVHYKIGKPTNNKYPVFVMDNPEHALTSKKNFDPLYNVELLECESHNVFYIIDPVLTLGTSTRDKKAVKDFWKTVGLYPYNDKVYRGNNFNLVVKKLIPLRIYAGV